MTNPTTNRSEYYDSTTTQTAYAVRPEYSWGTDVQSRFHDPIGLSGHYVVDGRGNLRAYQRELQEQIQEQLVEDLNDPSLAQDEKVSLLNNFHSSLVSFSRMWNQYINDELSSYYLRPVVSVSERGHIVLEWINDGQRVALSFRAGYRAVFVDLTGPESHSEVVSIIDSIPRRVLAAFKRISSSNVHRKF